MQIRYYDSQSLIYFIGGGNTEWQVLKQLFNDGDITVVETHIVYDLTVKNMCCC